MKLNKIAENVYEIHMGMVCAYLIIGNDGLVLIDTGFSGNEKLIVKAIEILNYTIRDLNYILITQLHQDHTGNLAFLQKKSGAKVYAHQHESEAIESGITIRTSVPAPTFKNRLIFKLFVQKNPRISCEGTKVDVKLAGGEVLDFAKDIKVINTPGHTVGHVSYFLPIDGGILFVGDAASGGRVPGYPVLFEDTEMGLKTLKMLGTLAFDKAYFCHGKAILENASEVFKATF